MFVSCWCGGHGGTTSALTNVSSVMRRRFVCEPSVQFGETGIPEIFTPNGQRRPFANGELATQRNHLVARPFDAEGRS